MDYTTQIAEAKEKFGKLLEEQLKRVEDMKAQGDFLDYTALPTIKIGVCGGDGIGPAITAQAQRILEYLLADEVKSGKVEFKVIDGLTIERRVEENAAIPADVLEELKEYHLQRLLHKELLLRFHELSQIIPHHDELEVLCLQLQCAFYF